MSLFVVLIAVFFNSRGRRTLGAIVMMAAAGINLYQDYRSLAGEFFVAGAYLLLARFVHARSRESARASAGQTLVACVALALSTAALLRIYAYCAGSRLPGYAAWQNYEIQSSGRYGVLIGDRGGFLAGLRPRRIPPS